MARAHFLQPVSQSLPGVEAVCSRLRTLGRRPGYPCGVLHRLADMAGRRASQYQALAQDRPVRGLSNVFQETRFLNQDGPERRPAASIASDRLDLASATMSSTSSSRLAWAISPVISPCSASVTTPCNAAQIFSPLRSRRNPTAGASSASTSRRKVSAAATWISLSLGAEATTREANIRRKSPLRRRPKSSVAWARRDSFERFDGLAIDSRKLAVNWWKASTVTAAIRVSRSAKCL